MKSNLRRRRGRNAAMSFSHALSETFIDAEKDHVARVWNKGVKEVLVILILTFGVVSSAILFRMRTPFKDRVERAVTALRPYAIRLVPYYVHRQVTDDIITFLSFGNRFLVIEGGHMMGKSVAVEMAIANLSTYIPVLRVEAKRSDSLEEMLMRLVGVNSILTDIMVQYLPNSPTTTHSVGDALLSRVSDRVTPVFVVERAEFLDVETTLKSPLDFAKNMADHGTGKIILVFSPTTKMDEIRHFSSLSRATILPVLDMTYAETRQYLTLRGCPEERINATYGLLGGHLSHFAGFDAMDPVSKFCGGAISVSQFEAEMLAQLGKSITASMRGIETEACVVLCAVANNTYGDYPEYSPAVLNLVKEHVIRSSLFDKAVIVDSPLLRQWMMKNCFCERHLM